MQNPFIWHDLTTPDVESAKKFYSAVVGWSSSEQFPGYTVFNVGKAGVGGIMETPPDMKSMPPMWMGYVFTPDVDAACKLAIKLGGKIYREAWDVPSVGRIAVIGDPTGAGLMIMQPRSTEQGEMAKEGAVGTIGWNELHAGDLIVAWDFYSALFGWTKGEAIDMGPMGPYQLFQIDGKDIGGMMKKMDSMPVPSWAYYFNVDGIDKAVDRISKAGGKIAMGPHQVPGDQWIVTGQDIQGAFFSLVSLKK